MLKTILNLKSYKWHYSGKYPQRYKAYDLKIKQNEGLKDLLIRFGFFDFHTTNHGYLVMEHQVVAYFLCGGFYASLLGIVCEEGKHEIHHINGMGFCNHPKNLVYLPHDIHVEITKSQRRVCKYLRVFNRTSVKKISLNLEDTVVWNRKGRVIKNLALWITIVLTQTLVENCKSFKVQYLPGEILRWQRRVLKALMSGLNTFFHVPTWILVVPNEQKFLS